MPIYKYDINNISNMSGNGLVNIIQETSRQTNFLPGILLDLMIFMVIFFILKSKGYTTIGCFATCNFMNLIIILLLYALRAVPGWWLIAGIIMLPLSFFLLWAGESF